MRKSPLVAGGMLLGASIYALEQFAVVLMESRDKKKEAVKADPVGFSTDLHDFASDYGMNPNPGMIGGNPFRRPFHCNVNPGMGMRPMPGSPAVTNKQRFGAAYNCDGFMQLFGRDHIVGDVTIGDQTYRVRGDLTDRGGNQWNMTGTAVEVFEGEGDFNFNEEA